MRFVIEETKFPKTNLKRHIDKLREIVKQRDEELLDLKMAMDSVRFDKSPRRDLSKNSEKKSRNLTKSHEDSVSQYKTTVLPMVRFDKLLSIID